MDETSIYEEVRRLRAKQGAESWRLAKIREDAMRKIMGKPPLYQVTPMRRRPSHW